MRSRCPRCRATCPSTVRPRLRRAVHYYRDLRDRHQGHRPVEPLRQGRQDGSVRRRRRARPLSSRSSSTTRPRSTAARRCSRAGERTARVLTLLRDERLRALSTRPASVRSDERALRSAVWRVGLAASPRRSTSAIRARTCFCSWTTSSASRRPARGVRSGWAVCPCRGYQPTLATEMGDLQERITSTTTAHHVGRPHVPADDLTDPAPATTFTHLDAKTVLSCSISELGIHLAVDLLESTFPRARPADRRRRALIAAVGIQELLQNYKDLQDIIAIPGMDELSEDQKKIVNRALQGVAVLRPVLPRGRAVHGPAGQVRQA